MTVHRERGVSRVAQEIEWGELLHHGRFSLEAADSRRAYVGRPFEEACAGSVAVKLD